MISQQPSEVLLEAEAKSIVSPGMPFGKIWTEIIERIQTPSESEETQNANKNDDADNTDETPSIEPLQAVQPNVNGDSASLPNLWRTSKLAK